jgi:hypothetical protein
VYCETWVMSLSVSRYFTDKVTVKPFFVCLKIGSSSSTNLRGSGAKFTQGECILYHEFKLEVFR